jgi:phage FluMu protein Com
MPQAKVESLTGQEIRCHKCNAFLCVLLRIEGVVELRFYCKRCKDRPTVTLREDHA